jgi:ribosome biogenesis protein ERB1
MAVKDSIKHTKKRKLPIEDALIEAPFESGDLEMLSDEEDGEDAKSDDGHVDEFPEIDTRSDSEGDGFEGAEDEDEDEEDTDEEDEEDEEGDSELHSDDSEMHIFPRAKTITSEITGHPKRVYPEIEPNYDSDSSTEDVRSLAITIH